MSSKSSNSETSDEIQRLIAKAKQVGFDEVPESTSELETKVVEILRQSKKIMTAKQMFSILQEKNAKWYSDKMWNLAKKGVLVKLETRGFYKHSETE